MADLGYDPSKKLTAVVIQQQKETFAPKPYTSRDSLERAKLDEQRAFFANLLQEDTMKCYWATQILTRGDDAKRALAGSKLSKETWKRFFDETKKNSKEAPFAAISWHRAVDFLRPTMFMILQHTPGFDTPYVYNGISVFDLWTVLGEEIPNELIVHCTKMAAICCKKEADQAKYRTKYLKLLRNSHNTDVAFRNAVTEKVRASKNGLLKKIGLVSSEEQVANLFQKRPNILVSAASVAPAVAKPVQVQNGLKKPKPKPKIFAPEPPQDDEEELKDLPVGELPALAPLTPMEEQEKNVKDALEAAKNAALLLSIDNDAFNKGIIKKVQWDFTRMPLVETIKGKRTWKFENVSKYIDQNDSWPRGFNKEVQELYVKASEKHQYSLPGSIIGQDQ